MPKTKTTFTIEKRLRISDLGNQMLANMWRVNKSSSEAEFIRDAITFFIQEKHPNHFEKWKTWDVPEINDFQHHDAREDGLTDKERDKLTENQKLYEKYFYSRNNKK